MLRFLAAAVAAAAACATVAPAQQPVTAQQIINRIQQHVGIAWRADTVDTFKAGDPDTPVTGVAVTMMATYDVLERAAASRENLVITHEPTFYSHLDRTADLAQHHDPVFAAKEAFIAQHHLVVWRFHDHWHARNPDGILLGMTHALGWTPFQKPADPHLYTMPATRVNDLAASIQQKLRIRVLRVVGDPDLRVTNIALLPGAAGSAKQIQLLERDDVQALVIGETPEWETVEYVADAVAEHKAKALVILGHIPSEQAGMNECAEWLRQFVTEVPVAFVPASEPFWSPAQP